MEILNKQPTVKAPAETFTGDAWFDVIAMWEAPGEGPETQWGDLVTDDEYHRR